MCEEIVKGIVMVVTTAASHVRAAQARGDSPTVVYYIYAAMFLLCEGTLAILKNSTANAPSSHVRVWK